MIFTFYKIHHFILNNGFFWKIILSIFVLVGITTSAYSQISGMVFRDYNSSGTRTTSFNPGSSTNLDLVEPLISGVIVNAYDDNNQIIASYTTNKGSNPTAGHTNYPFNGPNFSIPASGLAYNGTPGSNTGFVAAGTKVRLEFVIPPGGCNPSLDFDYSAFASGAAAQGSSVQFITAGSTANKVVYGINNPVDYNTGSTNNPADSNGTMLFTVRHLPGNPLDEGTGVGYNGRAARDYWFVGYPYGATSATPLNVTYALEGKYTGAVWGVAYSKQARKVFTSAFLKRHIGMGPMGQAVYTY